MDVPFSTDPPPDELITNIHVVCFVDDRIVLCRDDRDAWLVPGGTREAGEAIEDCVIRELREEAGARLAGPLRWLGAHYATSDRPTPYREWQPHPHKAWLWCSAEVVLGGAPTNPDDAEQILEVRAWPFDEAIRLAATDGAHMAELLGLAAELRGAG
ncbi:NUDIX domain-containing protein [Nocardia uniformis]|uniref:NUDIX domain-containing protein n=1 Tax=Nocardia uniformis TaxID=53432 RepID=A0A849BVB5_9NOCA|nr:NUDIX domain-containing protein [Nocardia uniformis]